MVPLPKIGDRRSEKKLDTTFSKTMADIGCIVESD